MMRLIAWNVNYNNRKHRPLEETVSLLQPLTADILVLSETAAPCAENPFNAQWIGAGNPGLAVIAPTGLQLIPHGANANAATLMSAFSVRGKVAFELLAIWPVHRTGSPSYDQVLTGALDRYSELLSSDRAIMAGDFNSSTRVSNQKHTHPRFVKLADSLGLISAYHVQTGEEHGEETVATYMHSCGATREFHIDYCFVAKSLQSHVKVNVLDNAEWAGRSDHFPLVLDICDDALRP